jgi:MFS family permease
MVASDAVEESGWTSLHTLIVTIFSVGAAVEAYVYSLSYIATTWVSIPSTIVPLLAAWPPLWLLVGGILGGFLADNYGRKKAMYFTMAFYVVGSAGLILSGAYTGVLLFIAILLLAAGGEYNTILTVTHELFPRRYRARALYIELNSTNLGGSLAPLLALLSVDTAAAQRQLLGVTLLVVVVALYVIRLRVPESVMWLEATGHVDKARRELQKYPAKMHPVNAPKMHPVNALGQQVRVPPIWFRVLVGALVGWAYTAGFSLLVLTLGPYFFPKLTDWLILVSGLTAFATGFVGVAADRISRRLLLMASSVGVVVVGYLFIQTLDTWLKHVFVFWILFVALSAFINTYFLTEDTLKSEVWPTRNRGKYTALVRVLSLGGTIPVVYLSSNLPIISYMWLGIAVFSAGLAAAVAWGIWGSETSMGRSVRIWEQSREP